MIKNEIFTPTTATTRNEIIEAIERDDMVIYIEGEACQELSNEVAEQTYKAKGDKKLGKGLLVTGAGIGAALTFLIPGIGWTIGGVALATWLGGTGIHALNNAEKDSILGKYYLAQDEVNGITDKVSRYILVKKDYSFEHHSLSDNSVLTIGNFCPKCRKGYDKKTMTCNNCGKHIIYVRKK